MSHKRSHSPDPLSRPDTEIHTSQAIHDRGSKFIALYSVSPTYRSNPKLLQAHDSLSGSMHRVLAWRKASAQTSLDAARRVFETFSDEDGETYAGKHVEKVLAQCDVEGVCVVGRWFGGVLLGPVRFEHIEKCAREAVEMASAKGMAKKARVEGEDEGVRKGLIAVLKERDESVRVLRGLLAEKQQMLGELQGDGKESPAKAATASPAKSVSYEGMSVAQLRGQEKARDATLTWVLKQIEGVEREIEPLIDLPNDESDGDGDVDADANADVATNAEIDGKPKVEREDRGEVKPELETKTEQEPVPETKDK